jgi:hypothetical protein
MKVFVGNPLPTNHYKYARPIKRYSTRRIEY